MRKKRAFNWKGIKAFIESEKTSPNLKKRWKKALELHNKGLSDVEVRKEMGW